MNKNQLVAIGLTTVFFVITFITLPDYGSSWDETLHFSRGHAYLNFFLTGKKVYSNFPKKSFYQLDYQNGDFWFKENGGHPPINGTLAALSNYIFYQKLGLLSDLHSYHLFNILVSSLLVYITVIFFLNIFGSFGAIVVFLTLLIYPLFFSESHFNVKDPALTTVFTLTIFFFYRFFKTTKTKWLLFFFISFGIGLGIKFNILFLPIIIILYLIYHFNFSFKNIFRWFYQLPKNQKFLFLVGPFISFGIFFITWPYLWYNWPNNLLSVFTYYKEIGTGTNYQPPNFYILGFNTYPWQWIIFTTPPVVLFLTAIGLFSVWRNHKKNDVVVLWLLWLLVPILRVTFPGASIYGGIRQIMEFIPALALISGLGAVKILEWTKSFFKNYNYQKKLITQFFIIFIFLYPAFILIKLYPNQNVYFNSFIGGLSGAKQTNFPSWGNSYGNAYLQGIEWLNKNAPLNSKVALIQGTDTNAPTILFRPDIKMKNSNWSGLNRNGEYLMELTFNDTGKAFYYTWDYVDKFLEPVYELKVDNVAILKIWKNDPAHFKITYKNLKEVLYKGNIISTKIDNKLILELDREVKLSRLILNFKSNDDCFPITTVLIESSKDQHSWLKEGDSMPFTQLENKSNLENNRLIVYFADRKAKYIRFLFESAKSCGLIDPQAEIYTLSI